MASLALFQRCAGGPMPSLLRCTAAPSRRGWWGFFLLWITVMLLSSCNPFAPGFDDSPGTGESILGDQRTIDGVFQNIKYAYTFRDTTIYGQLINFDYTFVYRDYDRGVDVSWGRDEEMRISDQLFKNVQRIDLIWNNIIAGSSAAGDTTMSRNFNLTVTFNPSDIIRVDGYASLTLTRPSVQDPWRIKRWRDESNF